MAANQNSNLVSLRKGLVVVLWILTFVRVINCANSTSFQSRSDIQAPVLNIDLKNDRLLTPGYLFLTHYGVDLPGPYIFDTSGNLVWSGANRSSTDMFHNLHVCPYEGSDHLCYHQGVQTEGYTRGYYTILDDAYQETTTVHSGNGMFPGDLHELRVIDGKTALISVYQTEPYNLAAYGIGPGNGWVISGAFQEVDIKTGRVLFEWKSLDHVPLSATLTPLQLDGVVGDGRTNGSAWDYFHINSVDKNRDGDYLVSARHTSCIYKVSGATGSIIWQLGGTQSSFQLSGYNFSYQHDARFHEENETTTVLSFFDNASNLHQNTSSASSGKIVSIDHQTNTSTLTRQYHAPGNGLLSLFQGNTQVLPNKHVLIGWGNHPAISEHTEDGTAIFFATLESPGSQNYRAYKANWTAKPSDPPALRAYSASPNPATTFWVSWNGATDVDHWTIHATSPASDQFMPLEAVPSQGFQTTYTSSRYHPRAFAEAIAADGSSMANSSVVDTSSTLPGRG
ncbi:hypothetical protein KXX24_009270 [Aspergillus fumigatus]|nr:hypothetical protein KXX24_009270 [Aspergillus fumigatus]